MIKEKSKAQTCIGSPSPDGLTHLSNDRNGESGACPTVTIIPYDEKYRDDMIFMVLEAKNALGRIPRLNEDLLDIQKNYLEQGAVNWSFGIYTTKIVN